tara:strand:+ start:453 stop:818 length:366 start_codon:yes stop_codon:yes gene_type:complete
MKVSSLSLKNFSKKVLDCTSPCVVKFVNEGCYLCVNLKPIYENLSKEYSGKINFFEVDTLKEKKLTEIFSSEGVPTIFFFSGGNGVEITYPSDEVSGYSKESLNTFFDDFLAGKIKITKEK